MIMATEGARVWDLSLIFTWPSQLSVPRSRDATCSQRLFLQTFLCASAHVPRMCIPHWSCSKMARSAPHQIPFLGEQLSCSHQSARVHAGRSSRVLGSTCTTGLPVLGMPTQNHTATVGHKPTRIQVPLCERDVTTAPATRCHMDDTFATYTLNACCSIQLPIKHSSRGPPPLPQT